MRALRPIPEQRDLRPGHQGVERAALYLLFARIFREAPTPKLLREIVRRRPLPNADSRWPRQAEAIAVEYAQLFAVPSDQAVRPYESVYCDTLVIDASTACSTYFQPDPTAQGLPGFLHGPSCVAVRQAYHKAGFELDPGSHELPDHLAVELEFLGRLLERGDAEPARLFFKEHLGRWVFRCAEDVKRNKEALFYRAAAEALEGLLRAET